MDDADLNIAGLGGANLGDANYFSRTYDEARSRFVANATAIQQREPSAEVGSFRVPSRRDPHLFLDHFYLPPTEKTETLFVFTSGVHGVEGFAGSAIQQMILKDLLSQLPREHSGLLMFHSLNPFGFKYLRRSTEDNVNLNRNFAPTEEMFATANDGFDRLAQDLSADRPARLPALELIDTLTFVYKQLYVNSFTSETLNRSIAKGQFKHPRALEYGGTKREPQIDQFIAVMKDKVQAYRNIIVFDLHTGLGDRNVLHVIGVNEIKSRDPELFQRCFDLRADEAESLYRYTPTTSKGFYQTCGDMNSLIPHLITDNQRALALTFEFGTLGSHPFAKIQSLSRLMSENRAYFNGYTNTLAKRLSQRQFVELFNPSQEAWRRNVIQKARATLERVFLRMGDSNQ